LTGDEHVTDVTNASRTLLYDIHRQEWDEELLELFRVPRELLPRVVPTSTHVADISRGPLAGVALTALVGDQQAATFGQACFEPGQVKNTYGTGCFLVLNSGEQAPESPSRLLTTALWQLEGE